MDEKTRNAIERVVKYLAQDEKRDWEARGCPSDHIFTDVIRAWCWLVNPTGTPAVLQKEYEQSLSLVESGFTGLTLADVWGRNPPRSCPTPDIRDDEVDPF